MSTFVILTEHNSLGSHIFFFFQMKTLGNAKALFFFLLKSEVTKCLLAILFSFFFFYKEVCLEKAVFVVVSIKTG